MSARSVRQAIEEVRERGPLTLEVEGILVWEFENLCLNHWPKSEHHDHSSSMWLDSAGVAFRSNDEVLERWSGKKVVILGEVEVAPASPYEGLPYMGYGHFGLWPAQIKCRRIDLVKNRKRSEDHPDYL